MTLATRLSVFFLGTLAAVLIGFSATLYLLARTYLHRQVDDRLEAALDILSATAESKPDGIEWEARERPVSLEPPPGEEPIAWLVCDDQGRVIDAPHDRVLPRDESSWWVRNRRLPGETGSRAGSRETQSPEEKKTEKIYPFIVLTVGLPLDPVAATLRNLLLLLSGLSVALWLAAALVGGRLCRRALAPVLHMAEAAGSMNATDLGQRLPTVATGDELEELNRAFNQLLARLQESFEQQRRFTGDASHQLRTPLTAMLGQIEIALRRPRAAEEYHRTLTVLHGQALQMRQIVEMLLFLARAEAEAKSPQLERLDMRAWLGEHLASWSGHARAADLRTDIGGDGPLWVKAQAPLLGQLVDNLLDNACKYSPAGTPITVSLEDRGQRTEDRGQRTAGLFSVLCPLDFVCLIVTDTGCGIAVEDLPHVFEPFYRSAQARRQGVPGIGLGLAVAQRIALALGGTLRVQSQPEQGTRFTFQLPSRSV